MGECGCAYNDDRYTFPGPGDSFYLLTLAGDCRDCDAPSGITIELIEPGNILYDEYKQGEFTRGKLKFEKWPDSKGVAIITGMRMDEYVAALRSYLIGVSSSEMGSGDGLIDDAGAEVILEEMYEDAQVQPKIVKPVKSKR